MRQIYDHCAMFSKLSVDYHEKLWDFYIPKIAELKDNYTKDLQVTGKKLSNHKEEDVDVEEEVEEDKALLEISLTTNKASPFLKDSFKEKNL